MKRLALVLLLVLFSAPLGAQGFRGMGAEGFSQRLLPVLSLNFLDGSLSPLITFTRASTATYFDSSGTRQTAAIDEARFDHDPATLVPRGLLIEGSATNLLLHSEALDNAAWTKTRASVSANAIAAPDGQTTADKIVEDSTAAATHFASIGASVTGGAVYTLSAFGKAAERNWIQLEIAGSSTAATAYFDLSAGVVGTVSAGAGSNASATITQLPNGWFRLSLTATLNAVGGAETHYIRLADSDGGRVYSGDGASGAYAWGAQLETGSAATSYIATVASAVTREPDVAKVNDISFINENEGTFVAEFELNLTPTTTTRIYDLSNNAGTQEITQFFNSGLELRANVFDGTNNIITLGNAVVGNIHKAANAYAANDHAGAFDGALAPPDTSLTLPSGYDALWLGDSAAGGRNLNGWFRSLQYFRTRLPDNPLQQKTSE